MLLLGAWLAGGVGAGCRAGGGAGNAFSRASVLARFHAQYPGISLPADGPIAGVEDHLDLAYAGRPEGALRLDLFVPAGAGPFPGVVVVHGGGWQSGDRNMERPFARQLAARGFVTATVDYRLGAAGRFPHAVIDVKTAVRWLRQNAAAFRIDGARIGAVGASAGGQLVALAGASNGEIAFDGDDPAAAPAPGLTDLDAVVDIDGLANFADPALIVREVRAPAGPTAFLGGSFAQRPAAWAAASALSHVGPRSAPTLFIDSNAATPLLPGRREMRDRLLALGIDAVIIDVPGAPHPFWLVHPWFEPTVEQAAVFLRRHLYGPRPIAGP